MFFTMTNKNEDVLTSPLLLAFLLPRSEGPEDPKESDSLCLESEMFSSSNIFILLSMFFCRISSYSDSSSTLALTLVKLSFALEAAEPFVLLLEAAVVVLDPVGVFFFFPLLLLLRFLLGDP